MAKDADDPPELAEVTALSEAGRVEAVARRLASLRAAHENERWWQVEAGQVSLTLGLDEQAADYLRTAATKRGDNGSLWRRVKSLREGGVGRDALGEARVARVPGLAERWAATRRLPMATAAAELARLWSDAAAMRSGVPADPPVQEAEVSRSLWSAVDEHVRSLPEAERGVLRAAESVPASAALAQATRRLNQEGVPDDLLAVYRRWPWSEAGSRALLRYGDAELRAGRAGLASRAFEDVLTHAADGDVRTRAERGLDWSSAAAVVAEPVGIDAIERVLPPAAMAGASLTAAGGGRVLLATPTQLAMVEPGESEAAWVRGPMVPRVVQGRVRVEVPSPLPVSTPVTPAVEAGRVIVRWGMASRPSGGEGDGEDQSAGVAAFDLQTGAMLWWTDLRHAGRSLQPAGDPVVSAGRVYVAGLDGEAPLAGAMAPLRVEALDAATGESVWSAAVATVPVGLAVVGRNPKEDGPVPEVDLVSHGVSLTVDRGSVYVATQAGLVARLDARDGLLEWASSYRRGRLDPNSYGVLVARRGGPPVVAGDLVIVAPRDRHGVLAFDAATGAAAWDRPLAASREMLGLAESSVVLAGAEGVVALDAATGEERWYQAAQPRVTAATTSGGSVWVVDDRGLLAFDAATGQPQAISRLDEADAASDDAQNNQVQTVAMSGRRIVVTRRGEVANPPAVQTSEGKPRAASEERRVTLIDASPSLTWTLPRIEPRIVPPDGTKALADDLLVWSRGRLERIDPTTGESRWHRGLAVEGVRDVVPVGERVIAIAEDHLQAFDTATGDAAWSLDLPQPVSRWRVLDGRLLLTHRVGSFDRGLTAVDPIAGRVLWHHMDLQKDAHKDIDSLGAMHGYDGTLYLGITFKDPKGPAGIVALDPITGDVRWTRRVTPGDTSGADLTFSDTTPAQGIALDRRSRRLYPFTLKRDEVDVKADLKLPNSQKRGILLEYYLRSAVRDGDAVMVRLSSSHYDREGQALFRLGDAKPLSQSFRVGGMFRDGRFEVPDGGALVVIDPDNGRELRYAAPVPETPDQHPTILAHWRQDDGMLMVTGISRASLPRRIEPASLRLDVFDAGTGTHRRGGELPGVAFWQAHTGDTQAPPAPDDVWQQTQVIPRGEGLIVTDYDGVHRLDPAQPQGAGPSTGPVDRHIPAATTSRSGHRYHVAYTATGTPPPPDARVPAPTLDIAHDRGNLLLTLRVPAATLHPRRGTGPLGGGDFVQVMMHGPGGHLQLLAGLDERGRGVIESLGNGDQPGSTAALASSVAGELDVTTMTQVWRLRLPLEPMLPTTRDAHDEVELSVTAWGEVAGGLGVRAAWGGTPGTPHAMPPDAMRIALQPMTPDEEAAAIDMVRAMPEVEGVRAIFRELAAAYEGDAEAAAAFARRALGDQPSDPLAALVLMWSDAAVRDTSTPGPLKAVLAVAREAGASDEAVAAYEQLAGAYVSQWVWIESREQADPPRMLMLRFQDDREGDAAWEHRVSWGEWLPPPTGDAETSARRLAGPVPTGEGWHELRVPLLWLGLHDRPIRGISFGRVGGGRVVWDDTAVVVGEQRWSLIDEDLPDKDERAMKNRWEWVEAPVHKGEKAHAAIPADSSEDATHHDLYDLEQPWGEHLAALAGPGTPAPLAPQEKLAAVATLERMVPRLGDSDAAVTALRTLQAVESDSGSSAASGDGVGIARVTWFARTLPRHPRLPEVLGELLQTLRDSGQEQAAAEATLEQVLEEAKLPQPVRYAYHRRYTPEPGTVLDRWLAVGPFDGGLETPLGPELAAWTSQTEFAVAGSGGGTQRPWTPQAEAGVVPLIRDDRPTRPGVTYAATTLTTTAGRAAMLELRAPGGVRVYLGGRLVWSSPRGDQATQATLPLYLRPGANPLLIKLVGEDEAYLQAELFTPDGRGGPDVTVTTPP